MRRPLSEGEHQNLWESLISSKKIPDHLKKMARQLDVDSGYDRPGLIRDKLQLIISFRETILAKNSVEPSIYSCSGLDWRFPVLLGLNNIVMVDTCFANKDSITNMVKEIAATLGVENLSVDTVIEFNLGGTHYKITPTAIEIDKYTPETQIGCLLEFLGVSHRYSEDVPILPAIAEKLHNGSLVALLTINDWYLSRIPGITPVKKTDGTTLYIVTNKEDLLEAAQISFAQKQSSQLPRIYGE